MARPDTSHADRRNAGPSTERAPRILATSTALPRHHYTQTGLVDLAGKLLPNLDLDEKVLKKLFRRAGVEERYLALPAEAYEKLQGLESKSRAWAEVATEVGERAVRGVLSEAGLDAGEVSQLMTTTVTGISVPTLDARLMNKVPFSTDLKRVPTFGLGCVGGAAGVARVSDYLRAYPEEAAILLSVELCSLTVQQGDVSKANLVSMALFGDGAAAVLLVGPDHPRAKEGRPLILDSRSVFFHDTERVMGWDMVDSGFKVVLSPDVPDVARENLPDAVDRFLDAHGLRREDIEAWVSHPGGPKVMDAVEEGLDLESGELDPAREGLARVGNLSSASVLFLLDDFRRRINPSPGSYGLMLAMGPAFCAELVLLQW